MGLTWRNAAIPFSLLPTSSSAQAMPATPCFPCATSPLDARFSPSWVFALLWVLASSGYYNSSLWPTCFLTALHFKSSTNTYIVYNVDRHSSRPYYYGFRHAVIRCTAVVHFLQQHLFPRSAPNHRPKFRCSRRRRKLGCCQVAPLKTLTT